jgi:hypothetical protein
MPILGILASAQIGASSNSYFSIATITGGGGTSVTFSSIPSTYKHLQIRGIARTDRAAGGSPLEMQFNGNTSSNYRSHVDIWSNGSSTLSAYDQGQGTYISADSPIAGGNVTASGYGAFVIDILDYTNTNKYKTVRIFGGYDSSGSGQLSLTSGFFLANTNAITDITIPTIGNYQSNCSFALYGIKG